MITSDLSQNPNFSSLLSPFRRPRTLPRRRRISPKSPFSPVHSLGGSALLRFHRNPRFQVYAENGRIGGLGVSTDDALKSRNSYNLVDLIVTHRLPPALSYWHAVDSLRAAVEELKQNPPDSASGVLRFQVAMPPSTKAVNWLYCQQESLTTFPHFCCSSKQSPHSSFQMNEMVAVSGIGAAIFFHGSLCTLKGSYLMESVKYLLVQTKSELQHALGTSQKGQIDCIIEVESCIADNADFHRTITKYAHQVADEAINIISELPFSEDAHDQIFSCKIHTMEYSLYRIELSAPTTSSNLKNGRGTFYREGFILTILLDDGSVGFGEVAPIEIHKEDLIDVEDQLRFLLHIIEGCEISCLLSLLKGTFSRWILKSLGIPPSSIFPSVRCAIEMAILNALAVRHGSGLFNQIEGFRRLPIYTQSIPDDITIKSEKIQVCALIDCKGTPKEVAHVVSQLVDEGFTTVKLKVARRENPIEDAIVIQEIRETLGYQVNIRVDANRRWTYEEAIQFGSLVKKFDLQYIEEPVRPEDDIIKFCEESSLRVALDETIDDLKVDILDHLKEFIHPGIVAVVIKPSVVGGFENASLIAKWAQMHGKMAVISSAFETSLSLSVYIHFAHYIEQQNAMICKMKSRELKIIAHGLGTYRWLKQDITTQALKICVASNGDAMEASVEDADNFLRCFQVNRETIQRTYTGEQVKSYQRIVNSDGLSFLVNLQETGGDKDKKVVIFLHGFLGTSQDWIPIMKAVSTTARCISVDLPGHGESRMQWYINNKSEQGFVISVESVAHMLLELISDVTTEKVVLVGYSMGARIALYMALTFDDKIDRAIIISGSPGLKDEETRKFRTAQDEARARYLLSFGLQCFLETWYTSKFWKSLRGHPHFKRIIASRAKHDDIQGLAKALTDLSIGRQKSLWEELRHCKRPLLIIVGENDTKFKDISNQMCREIDSGSGLCEMVVVPDCGHAVHLENPLHVISKVMKFISK